MIRRGRPGWAALALCLALSGHALAEPTAEDKAAAESLFQDALKLIRDNKYTEACPKLEASNKLDPAVGTLFNLGDCYEHTGRTASAWSTFGEARRLAERLKDRRATDAAEREKALEPKLAKLAVQVAEKPDGLVILRDKKPIDTALLGTAVPVDPGKHTIEAQAPGREPWSTVVDVPDGPGTVTMNVPPLAAARVTGPGPTATGEPVRPPPSGMSTQKIVGLSVGGVGVAGMIVGGIFGGLAAAKVSDSAPFCVQGNPVRCSEPGLALRREANELANVSNVGFAAGAVLTIGGVLLFLLAPTVVPSPDPPSPDRLSQGSRRPTASPSLSVRVAPAVGAVNGVFVTGSY